MKFPSKTIILFVNVLLGGLMAYMMGSLLSSWIHHQFFSLTSPPSKDSEFETKKITKDFGESKKSFQVILERNIFNAQKNEIDILVPVQEKEEILPENTEVDDPENSHEEGIENTELEIALAGTMIYSEKNSFAFISKKESLNKYVIFGIGECFHAETIQRDKECLSDSVKVLKIKDRWVLILYQEKKQALRMVSSISIEESTSTRSIDSKKKQKYKSLKKKLNLSNLPKKEIVKTEKKSIPEKLINNGNTFHFKRVWVDEQLANFEQLLSDARVVPIKKNEKPYFMFQFIKGESIYEKLGLKKNDIILEINGFFVDSVGKALKLLEVLQSEREISLKVERGGKPVKFHYYIN